MMMGWQHSQALSAIRMPPSELVAISTGSLNVQHRFSSPEYYLDEASNTDSLFHIATIQRVPTGHINLSQPNRNKILLELIKIYQFYNVLRIEWEGGIAYRKALGRVFRKAWESQKLEEIDIVLG